MKPFKSPLLAASLMPSSMEHTDTNILYQMQKLKYPVAATCKIDGIRGVRYNGWILSRTLKRIPNVVVAKLGLVMPPEWDFEICRDDLSYNDNQSIIMSEEHPLSHTMEFHVLDWYREGGYMTRMDAIARKMPDMYPFIHHEYPTICNNADELFKFFLAAEAADGEGICFRNPSGLYVQKGGVENRSTLNEQTLVKLSRYIYDEATITGFYEQMENGNDEARSATGKMNRSSCVANQFGKNTLGGLITTAGNVATGFNNRLRQEIWHNQSKFLGRTITFKRKPFGQKNKPRSPIFVGFRREGF